jgi:integrase
MEHPAEIATEKAASRTVKLSMASAKAARPPEKGDYILRDPEHRSLGLGLRVYFTGKKTWIAQKKIGKSPVRVDLGDFPAINLEQAIKLAQEIAVEFAQGRNPNDERRKRKVAEEEAKVKNGLTVSVAFDEYEDAKKRECSARTIKDREAAHNRLMIGNLWETPLAQVDGNALSIEYRRLIGLTKHGTNQGKTQAGATMRWLRAAINHAFTTRKIFAVNPFDMFNELHPDWYRVNRRTRIVAATEGQLASWWKAVENLRNKNDKRAKDARTIADYLTLSILFGTRRIELLPLKWTDVSLKDGTATFPGTKNGTEHVVPFGGYARGILERRHAANQQAETPSVYVFAGSRPSRKGEYSYVQEPKKTIKKVVDESGVPFSSHDLRRTFATLIEEIEHVSTLTVEKVLNHAPTTTAGKHYIVQRIQRLRPLYQRFEDAILLEAGVTKAKQLDEATESTSAIRVRKDGDQFIASMDTPDGPLEAVGAAAKEARQLLQSMI